MQMPDHAATLMDLQPLASGSVGFGEENAQRFLFTDGISGREEVGRWTDGTNASITFRLPEGVCGDIIVTLEFSAFISEPGPDRQIVIVLVDGCPCARWTRREGGARIEFALVPGKLVAPGPFVTLDLELPDCAVPADLGVADDVRRLGILLHTLSWRAVYEKPDEADWIWQLGRSVGGEARKSFDQKIVSGFWSRFVTGPHVLDIGFKGYVEAGIVVPITPTAIGLDLDYPGYDGRTLPFADCSQDAVFSSHCLEHIPDPCGAIREWHRVTKIGGHIITVVPHAHLYEKVVSPPSKWNGDHQRFYTPASLLEEFETALAPNTYRVRFLEDNDRGYTYQFGPETHAGGCYEIVLVIEKIKPPSWVLEAARPVVEQSADPVPVPQGPKGRGIWENARVFGSFTQKIASSLFRRPR